MNLYLQFVDPGCTYLPKTAAASQYPCAQPMRVRLPGAHQRAQHPNQCSGHLSQCFTLKHQTVLDPTALSLLQRRLTLPRQDKAHAKELNGLSENFLQRNGRFTG